MVDFTVGITNYNYGNYLKHSIKSALEQGADVIVVDDCSTDDSNDIISRFGDVINTITHERGSGSCVQGCKEIIREATGDWLIMLDADDYLLPGALKTYREYARDADWLVCNLAVVNANDQICTTWDYADWPMTPEGALELARTNLCMPVSMKGAFRIGWLRDNGLSWCAWETNKFADDCRTCLEYLGHSPRIKHVPYTLYAYREHSGQGSKDTEEQQKFVRDIAAYFGEENK